MTKNLTLRLDEVLLKKCRHAAVEKNLSLSQWVAQVITREVLRDEPAGKARADALRYLDKGFRLGGRPLKRNEAHER
jgi:hypothetical protein